VRKGNCEKKLEPGNDNTTNFCISQEDGFQIVIILKFLKTIFELYINNTRGFTL
jgi:hypothetical protein